MRVSIGSRSEGDGMGYRFEAEEVVRVVHSNLDQPDEKKKLANIFDAVMLQWEDLIQADRLNLEQSAALQMIEDRLDSF
jgi:hypothetical protein